MRTLLRTLLLVLLVAHMVPYATSELLFLSSYRRCLAFSWLGGSIATAQNDRYLVLTCRRVFAMTLLVFLGFFYDCSSCLVRRITQLPES
jgi:hypothetical protein